MPFTKTLEAQVGTNQTDICEDSIAFTGKEEAQALPWGLVCSIVGEQGGWCGRSEPCLPPERGSVSHSVMANSSPPQQRPGSSVHGKFQGRILEQAAISSSSPRSHLLH